MAIKPVLINANICMMVSGAANAITEGDTKGLVWRFQAKATDWGPGMAKAMISRGWKTVSILAQQNPFVIPMIDPPKKQFAAAGVKVLDTVLYNPDQPSYRAGVQRIFGASPAPQAVMCLGLLTDFVWSCARRCAWARRARSWRYRSWQREGKFVEAVGPDVAEGIEHFQPAPPSAVRDKRFQNAGRAVRRAGLQLPVVPGRAEVVSHRRSACSAAWGECVVSGPQQQRDSRRAGW